MRGPARSRPSSLPPLALSLQFADPAHRAVLPRHRVARWIRAALLRPAEIVVRIVGAEEGLALNRDYRGIAHPTNVLTFDYAHEPTVSGDLVLCAPVVEREAAEGRLELVAHYAHLIVHGTLHAQGFDHLEEAEAARMEAEEQRILAGLGFADPYASTSAAVAGTAASRGAVPAQECRSLRAASRAK